MRVRSLTKLRMSKARKKTTGDRLVIDELIANAKCRLRNRDGASLIACPILIPQTTITTAFDRSALDQVQELGGEGTPAAGHLKCKLHERLDGRINPVCIGEALPAFSLE